MMQLCRGPSLQCPDMLACTCRQSQVMPAVAALLAFLEAVFWGQNSLPTSVPAVTEDDAASVAAAKAATAQMQDGAKLRHCQQLATQALLLAGGLRTAQAEAMQALQWPEVMPDIDEDMLTRYAEPIERRSAAVSGAQAAVTAELRALRALHQLLNDRHALPGTQAHAQPEGERPEDDAAMATKLAAEGQRAAEALLQRAKACRLALERIRAAMQPELAAVGSGASSQEVRLAQGACRIRAHLHGPQQVHQSLACDAQ